MKLGRKKSLAARALDVGHQRIKFVGPRKDEIKEAITKQDIKDLVSSGAIVVKERSGRKKIEKRKNPRGPGKIKKKINTRKQDYVKKTRKFRNYIKKLKDAEKITSGEYKEIRKKIRNKEFRDKSQLKRYIENLNR
ncbi:MAG: 50S ribosomal protein L19e [Candidatus Pacearchaeota archaeon]